MTYIGEEFQKRFKTLPEDIQKALTAVASVDAIFAIGKKHGLMVDQIGKMADEIWKVMLGLANPKDFIRNLTSTLGIESEKASTIASEVNTQMFQPMRESLRKMYDQVSSSTYHVSSENKEDKKEKVSEQDTRYKIQDTKPHVPPMIFPQNRFEESFKKEPHQMSNPEGRTKEEYEQLAPLVPSVVERPPPPPMVSQPPPSPPPPKKEDDFTYPEKTKEVSREPAIGGYKSRDPYRESIEE